VHTSIAARINHQLRNAGLSDVGRLEEAVIFGQATSKDIVTLLNEFRAGGKGDGSDLDQAIKLRLLLLYAASHPEKFDDAERTRWSKATGLTTEQLKCIGCLEFLGARTEKRKGVGGKMASFKTKKTKRPTVHERRSEWDLNRFLPTIHILAKALDAQTLAPDAFPALGGLVASPRAGDDDGGDVFDGGKNPFAATTAATATKPTKHTVGAVTHNPIASAPKTPGKSMRTRPGGRSASQRSFGSAEELGDLTGGVAGHRRAGSSAAGGSGGAGVGGSIPGVGGDEPQHRRTGSIAKRCAKQPRLFVFIVGGVTRGETREAEALSEKLGREVVVGGTDVMTPEEFVNELASLGGGGGLGAIARDAEDVEIDLDDLDLGDLSP
jgi:syntaxin-binding protein 1